MDEGNRSESDEEPAERTESSVTGTGAVDEGKGGAESSDEDGSATPSDERGESGPAERRDVGSSADGAGDPRSEVERGRSSETNTTGPSETSDTDDPSETVDPGSGTDASGPGDGTNTSDPDGTDGPGKAEGAAGGDSVGSRGSVTGTGPDAPPAGDELDMGDADEGLLYRFRHDREGILMWIREMLSSVAIVLVIGLILFGVSGVWPPMVAVESGSMEPNMEVGDLVFVSEPGRLAPDAADNDIGVVTHEVGASVDYRTFGSYGSVVIYRPPGRTASPIIHRAMFHVEEGENWHDRADGEFHNAANCADLRHCPAPHDGFITLGDNNGAYDQANGLAPPVRAEWITGVARLRIPYLGYVRLIATGQAEVGDVLATVVEVRTYGAGGADVGLRTGDRGMVSAGADGAAAVG